MESGLFGASIAFDIINKGYKDVFIEKPYLCVDKTDEMVTALMGYTDPPDKKNIYPIKIPCRGKHTVTYKINKLLNPIDEAKARGLQINKLFIGVKTGLNNIVYSESFDYQKIRERNSPFISKEHFRIVFERNENEKKTIIEIMKLATPPHFKKATFGEISDILSKGNLTAKKRAYQHSRNLRKKGYITWDGPIDVIRMDSILIFLKDYKIKDFSGDIDQIKLIIDEHCL